MQRLTLQKKQKYNFGDKSNLPTSSNSFDSATTVSDWETEFDSVEVGGIEPPSKKFLKTNLQA